MSLPIELKINPSEATILVHYTNEISKVIYPEKCDLIITMNITLGLLRSIADRDTVLYYVSCHKKPDNLVKKAIPIATSHMKVYRTPTRVIFSSANASLSSWLELSVVFPRSSELVEFTDKLTQVLKKRDSFLAKFW